MSVARGRGGAASGVLLPAFRRSGNVVVSASNVFRPQGWGSHTQELVAPCNLMIV